MTPIHLGESYTDTITGFTGVATGRAEYLFESPSVKLERHVDAGGDADEDIWISELRLVPAEAAQASEAA